MPTFSIFGRRLRPDDAAFVEALVEARARRHRPRCLCASPAPEMCIARWCDRYVLKRMPLTGDRHAPTCPSSKPWVCLLPGKSTDAAPTNRHTGMETLWPAFALSRREPMGSAAMARPAQGSSNDGHPRVSLRGLLDYLWEQAELDRWHPGFAGRRTWAIVRLRLLRAAAGRFLGGQALSDCLFIPKAFRMAWPEANARRLSVHWHRTMAQRPGHPLTLLVGELKSIQAEPDGEARAFIWHLARCPFILSASLYLDVCRRFGRDLSAWASSKGARIVIIATFRVEGAEAPRIEEISLMSTASEWLPLDDPFDRRLAEVLVAQGRHFRKVAGRRQPDRCPPPFELLDTADPPTPLLVEKCRGEALASEQSTDKWVWRFGDPCLPPFPASTTRATEPHDPADGYLARASSPYAAAPRPDSPKTDDVPSGMPRLSHTTAA